MIRTMDKLCLAFGVGVHVLHSGAFTMHFAAHQMGFQLRVYAHYPYISSDWLL